MIDNGPPAAHAHVMALAAYMTALTAALRLTKALDDDGLAAIEKAAVASLPSASREAGEAMVRLIVRNSETIFETS